MFEAVEIGRSLSRRESEERLSELRVDLLNAQFDLARADTSVIVLIEGDDRPACQEVLALTREILDARQIRTLAMGRRTDEERARPHFWRYWRHLPRHGQMATVLDGWVFEILRDRLEGKLDDGQLARRLEHVRRFERALVDDGTLLLKLWLHVPKRALGKRLARARKHPESAWRLGPRDQQIYDRYDEIIPLAEQILAATGSGHTSWHLVESTDSHSMRVDVAEILLQRLSRHLATTNGRPTPSPADDPPVAPVTLLDRVDLSRSIPKKRYEALLDEEQAKLARVTRDLHAARRSAVFVFEGWDAGGKGGAIRRMVRPINPRHIELVSVAAPSEEELAHHYLWRFWKFVPRAGQMTVFDRSWYGRVLVERVEGLAPEEDWRRAYAEIRDFEQQLEDAGTVVLKFWMHIDQAEQLRRFELREHTPYKKHKITPDDYRNRDRWHAYEEAVEEVVQRTSTIAAPWHLVAANDKRHARIEVLRTVRKTLKAALKEKG